VQAAFADHLPRSVYGEGASDVATSVSSATRERTPLPEIDTTAVMRSLERDPTFCQALWFL
jgi:hypothetical protein